MRVLYRGLMVAVIGGVALAVPGAASAQHAQDRQGFWFNVGMGVGTLGCQDCSSRTRGASGSLALGGTLGERWLLGVGVTGWTKSESGATLTASTVTATARFYPTPSGFFLLGGLGLGTLATSIEFEGIGFSADRNGAGAVFGLGYDIRVGRGVSITPFWNAFAIAFDGGDANVGQVGVGVTIH